MKAVLVIDMPESCSQCDFIKMRSRFCYCGINGKNINCNMALSKPSFCPLRPLPERRNIEDYRNLGKTAFGKYLGWNECLDAIVGDQNENN